MSVPLSQLRELIGGLSSSQESDLLLLQLDAENAHRLRLCAISHTFDDEVLRALDPALSAEDAEQVLAEFQLLPAVTPLGNCFALHDVVRQQLFAQWLATGREEFAAASARLVELYRPRSEDSAVEAASRQSSRLFHALGADLARGFREFQHVYQARREQARYGDCEALLRLLREYTPALDPDQRSWMAYYEAEIADDSRNTADAAGQLDALLARKLPGELRSLALLRAGSVLRRLGRLAQARARCAEALQVSGQPGRGAARHLIHQELGLIARDSGDFDGARAELESALELARNGAGPRDVAIAYNSLGTLLLKPDPAEAARLFGDCFALLDPERDSLRIAQVLNNLGLANAEIRDWRASEDAFSRSLEIKRHARDIYGEASTLLNVARVYRAQGKSGEARAALLQSAELFESAHDPTRAGQAHRELARLAQESAAAVDVQLHAGQAADCFHRAGRDTEAQAVRDEFTNSRWRRWSWLLWTVLAILLLLLFGFAIAVLVEMESQRRHHVSVSDVSAGLSAIASASVARMSVATSGVTSDGAPHVATRMPPARPPARSKDTARFI